MHLKKIDIHEPDIDFLKDAVDIKTNDENFKPDWVESPALFTEFYVKKNKKNLLVVIGESWTYGESLPGIATGKNQFSFASQLKFTHGPRTATILDTDLYQYAVPGNCNFYMFAELDRILKYVSTLGYEKIFVSLQMTEPARENPIIDKLRKAKHNLVSIINTKKKITLEKWLERYDEIFFDQYDDIISKYNNVEAVLWKNFCSINADASNRQFTVIPITWIEYSARMLSIKITSPSFYSVGWIDFIKNHTDEYKHIQFDKHMLLKEMEKIELSNNFIGSNQFHNHHPNVFAHLLWAQYIARKAGWVDDI